MIRILHVIGSLNNGGSQAMIMNLYRKIDKSEIQFDFVIHREDEIYLAEEIKSLGGKIFFIPKFDMKNIYGYIKAWNEFFKVHNEYKIIHGHVRSTAAIYLKVAKKYGLITISHSHSISSGKGILSLIKTIMQYPIRYISDYYFSCSMEAGQWLFGSKVCEGNNFFIIKNAIDAKQFIYNSTKSKEIKNKFNLGDKKVIGHVGRFDSVKNHDLLIDIMNNIVSNYDKEIVLILVGDGEGRKRIEDKVSKLNLNNNVLFLGARSDINDILQAIDIFVFPSKYEGLGIAAIEAQASGITCILSDCIPKEAHITNLVKVIGLNEDIEVWSDKILENIFNNNRRNMYFDIKKAGYDINETVQWIQKKYIEMMRNRDEISFCNR